MVRVLLALHGASLQRPGRLGPSAAAESAAKAAAVERDQSSWCRRAALAESLLCDAGAVQPEGSRCGGRQPSVREDHRLESRMREICTSGSEGGGTESNRSSLPLSKRRRTVDGSGPWISDVFQALLG